MQAMPAPISFAAAGSIIILLGSGFLGVCGR
jgi:hypothetical protein